MNEKIIDTTSFATSEVVEIPSELWGPAVWNSFVKLSVSDDGLPVATGSESVVDQINSISDVVLEHASVKLNVSQSNLLTANVPDNEPASYPIEIEMDGGRRTHLCYRCHELKRYDKHGLRKCRLYKENKKHLSTKSYLERSLRSNDEIGFCAGGIIPYFIIGKDHYIMCLEEKRDDVCALNFAAGGRECISINGIIRPETSIETAMNEFSEEVGDIISPESFIPFFNMIQKTTRSKVFFSAQSKMVLYFVQVDEMCCTSLIKKDILPTFIEAHDFKWVKLDSSGKLEDGGVFHNFAENIIAEITLLSGGNLWNGISS